MTILVVEDDEYKATDVCRVVADMAPGRQIVRAASVTSALRAITGNTYDLVVLDMSLPTFDMSQPGGGGSPQSQGGIEVLRLMARASSKPPIIVITQYPDIEFDGIEVPLAGAAYRLSQRFKLQVEACLAYEFDGGGWRRELIEALQRLDLGPGGGS